MAVELSFCVVNTEQRELLVRCLDAIAAEREALPFETEVLVLDNASGDGSPAAARNHALAPEVIALERRTGKGENDTALLKRARGRYALLLNEDSELRPGAVMALREALEERDDAAAAGARLLRPDGTRAGQRVALPHADDRPRRGAVPAQALHGPEPRRSARAGSTGRSPPACSCAPTPRARSSGSTPPSSSTPTRSTSAGACATRAGARSTCRPRSPSTTSSSRPARCPSGGSSSSRATATATCASTTPRGAAAVVRVLTAWAYAVRSLAALALPGHDPRRYWRHVTATLRPDRGEGLREAAVEHNRGPRL